MPTVDDLSASFLTMPYDKQVAFIRDIRQARRTPPPNPKAYKKKAKGVRKAKTGVVGSTKNLSPKALASALSPEDKLKLLKELGVI